MERPLGLRGAILYLLNVTPSRICFAPSLEHRRAAADRGIGLELVHCRTRLRGDQSGGLVA